MIDSLSQAAKHGNTVAIISGGKSYPYNQLLQGAQAVASALLNGKSDLEEARVAFMVTPGFNYVAVMWGIWQAGGVAVPLCLSHPAPMLGYTLEDSESHVVVCSEEFKSLVEPLTLQRPLRLLSAEELTAGEATGQLPVIASQRRALILYTSGTTNLPKGVVTTHENIRAQIRMLIEAWKWTSKDHTLCVLPLHHVHGIINVVSCSLWAGATCEFLPKFDPKEVFHIFLKGQVNVFMAVPTVYFKLITYWDTIEGGDQKRILNALRSFRLMVSGSAALPASTMDKWQIISGHKLLERYGMTELGMAISNPYNAERRTGYVGQPLPGVSIRLANENDEAIVSEPGEIQVKGDNVFVEYWNKPNETKKAFTADGWFRTGDVAVLEDGYYRIMGRNSTDIIKTGGHKISALEIEEVLRLNTVIEDCAVIGIEDSEWGEIVGAAVVLKTGRVDTDGLAEAANERLCLELQSWLRERLPNYSLPRKFLMLKELPRNAMGKVTKNELKKLF